MTIISTTVGEESLRRNGVALIVNKRVQNAVLGCNLKNDRMISVHFQGKPLEMTRDHSVIFEIASKYCISDSFVDHDG